MLCCTLPASAKLGSLGVSTSGRREHSAGSLLTASPSVLCVLLLSTAGHAKSFVHCGDEGWVVGQEGGAGHPVKCGRADLLRHAAALSGYGCRKHSKTLPLAPACVWRCLPACLYFHQILICGTDWEEGGIAGELCMLPAPAGPTSVSHMSLLYLCVEDGRGGCVKCLWRLHSCEACLCLLYDM